MYLSERQKISLKRIIVFILSLVLIIEAFFQYGQQAFVKAKEQAEAKYALYIDTSMVGVDAELLENGIGAYFYDAYGNASSESPIIMEKVGDRDHLYKVDIDEQYSYVTFTEGTDSNTAECTSRIAIDWGLGVPCFKLNSENVADGGTFYGLYTVYFDTNNVVGSETFTENGVGVYAYNSETESYSSTPVAMKESDKGEGIYEYSFDQPYQYIAFMNGYDNWNYSIATSPVYTEWGYAAPCFLLQTVNGEASTGLWWNLTSVVYFDASEIKDDDAFVENGVYLYAYNEKENGEKELLSDTPVKMLASGKGEDMYEYTLDKPYENVQYILGDSFDAEIQSEVIAIDWLNYAEPCYKMILERTDEVSVSSSDAEEVEIGSIEVPPKSEVENVSDEEALQPMDEARVTADGLSAIRVSHTMEWLGANNTLSANTVSSNDTNTTDENTTDGDDTDGTTSDGTDTDEDSTDENTTDESTTGDVQVDGELTDIGGDATTATVAAAVTFAAARSASSTKKTIYFYTCGNGNWNSWYNCSMYIHAYDNSGNKMSTNPTAMDESTRTYTLKTPTSSVGATPWKLYEITIDTSVYQNIIFVNNGAWTNDGARQTVSIDLTSGDWADATHPCFALNGGNSGSYKTVEYLGDFGPLTQAGNSMYFVDMTSTITGTVTAKFTNSNGDVATVIPNSQGVYAIPTSTSVDSSGEEIPYTTVTFYNAAGTAISSSYNFMNNPATGEVGFTYNDYSMNTFYYGVTEKTSGTIVSNWGAKAKSDSLAGNTLYFSTTNFPTATGGKLQIGSDTTIELTTNGTSMLSYTFEDTSTATQETILTFIATDGTEYHFLWSDFNANVVTLSSDVADVTDTYHAATTVYFDATYSKLSYASDGSANASTGIPSNGGTGTIYYYATKSTDSSAVQKGEMTKVNEYTKDNHTWNDVYKTDILPEGFDQIIFANYELTSITNYGGFGNSTTTLDIPVIKNPCFYADGGDSTVYYNFNSGMAGRRGGYWDTVYSIRDAEDGKSTSTDKKDVVDIKESDFTRDPKILYISSTFYDYYSDYELNGYNRDDYGASIGGSQRNWVTFRQFDQALSDYYDNGDNSAAIPIYTGHFQPTYYNSKDYEPTWFKTIASTLNLYGYSDVNPNYGRFFSTNNSTLNVNGVDKINSSTKTAEGNGYYAYAAQGLVSDTMINDTLMMQTTSNGVIEEPHFNKDFLLGNNSKNAVLGEVYENVSFPFKQVDRDGNGVKYWTFDSADTTLAMKYDKDVGYFLEEVGNMTDRTNPAWSQNVNSGSDTSGVSNTYGFFPFNETSTAEIASTYNYGFGTKLEFQFRLTADGKVKDKDGKEIPITFKFSGDDDVWVFIDDKLVLDVGGSHGVVTAEIEFTDHADSDVLAADADTETNGRQIKSTVSHVKASAGSSTAGADVVSYYTLEETTKTEHTLTMYYMERGMWESNMSISFNFPDENQFEVEKQVDKTDVNDMFKDLFEGVSLFEYTIKNQATHYGTVAATGNSTVSKVIFNNTFYDSTIENVGNNTFSYTESITDKNDVTKTDVVHWYAKLDDANGSYRSARYGTIYANNVIDGEAEDEDDADDGIIKGTDSKGNAVDYVDISQMSYLEFKYYYDYTDAPSLSYMYLQLIDTEGNIKGNITDYLSSKSYGAVTNASKQWVTVKIDLSALAEQDGFNDKVVAIKFGYNYPRNFYLDDFIFRPVGQAEETYGFVKKQYTISDYGSAADGELKVAENALYSSSVTDELRLVDEEGHFYLQDGETVVFKDQFRRGSYIYLEETSNPLFDTTWTMYENGEPVTEIVKSTQGVLTTSDIITTLENVDGYTTLENVYGHKIEDGRTENKIEGTDEDGKTVQDGNLYDGTKPSTKNASDNTIVFRSYAYPDDASITTKLKVVYTNKINVGSLKIEKKKKYDNDDLGTYQFKITYSNVGGVALESGGIEQIVEVKAGESITIDGIPVGTYFTVEEILPEDGSSYLDSVTVTEPISGQQTMIVEEGNVVKGVVVEKTTDATISVVTFTNTQEPKISASMTKKWIDEVTQTEIKSNLPDSITVQLQRKVEGTDDSTYTAVANYEKIVIEPKQGDDGAVWSYTVTGLDQVYDYPSADSDDSNDYDKWIYRFVELEVNADGTYTVKENGQVITLVNGDGQVSDYEVTYEDPNKASDADQSSDPIPDDAGNYSTEITNTLLYVDLKIYKLAKTDDGNVDLKGVTFQLEKATTDEDGNLVYDDDDNLVYETASSEIETGEDGIATFANLENGTYRLTELQTATGYTLLKEPLIIEIDRENKVYRYRLESETEESDYKPLTLDIYDDTGAVTYSITLEIYNAQNIVLPATGWSSPISLATGIILLSICLAICLMYRCKISKSRREGKPPG